MVKLYVPAVNNVGIIKNNVIFIPEDATSEILICTESTAGDK